MSTIQLFNNQVDANASLPWLEDAACGNLDLGQLDMFFVGIGQTISPGAAVLCQTCPVSTECLQHALDRRLEPGSLAGRFDGMPPAQRRSTAMTAQLTN